jgi:hypothetical protein
VRSPSRGADSQRQAAGSFEKLTPHAHPSFAVHAYFGQKHRELIGSASTSNPARHFAADDRATPQQSSDMLESVEGLVRQFFTTIEDPEETFYNEASLQHELALFLRGTMPSTWRLHIERPASWFRSGATGLTKKEIDLVVVGAAREHVVAIELKCPRRGQHPEQMFKACQDLQFLEELVAAGFSGGLFAMHVHDPLFYERGSQAGIYAHFRGGSSICGLIQKPTGARDETASIRGSYIPTWSLSAGTHRYWIQPVSPLAR